MAFDSLPSPPPAAPSHQHEDYSNPFYLQHGDHPGAILVSQPLNSDNNLTWNRSMSMALISKNKLCFVNGALPPPPVLDPMHSAWIRCNIVVLSWLLNAMSKEIASSVIYIDFAEEMWKDLKERFAQSNRPHIFQIRKNIASLTQEASFVSSYFTRLKSCWGKMVHFRPLPSCSCGAIEKIVDFQQEDYVLQFLMGLNESYAYLHSQILLSDPFPPINKVFSLVLQEEKQREIVSDSLTPTKSVVMFSNRDSTRDFNRGSTGPPGSNGSKHGKTFVPRKDRPHCTHCGLSRHTIDKCYKIHGYPPRYKLRS
ncbi:uncharacterized protein LOC121247272 [Juglans microcarpa x Juglans regia]|uniref:uncharacterized protein LOC121247272 n=1 Tax=Juglans microcarpa x Juglans regia TaxID=2249226 RepID=UPI001B7F3419|nr:uncharacterized protein LOC121247272 [Juglans microcarpa x Juglans regia]